MRLPDKYRRWLITVLFFIATMPGFAALEDLAKAEVAQILIARTWAKEDPNALPWPWADSRPVARLLIESLDMDVLVLDGGNGHAMAFGPGMTEASVPVGSTGVTLFSAHRDTHFSELENIEAGMEIKVQDVHRQWHYYLVKEINIIDDEDQVMLNDTPVPTLVLSTCYPFDVLIMNSTQRMLVSAQWQRTVTVSEHNQLN